jgi:hypothetical protein
MPERSFGHRNLSGTSISGAQFKSHLLLCLFSALFLLASGHRIAAQTWTAGNGNDTHAQGQSPMDLQASDSTGIDPWRIAPGNRPIKRRF